MINHTQGWSVVQLYGLMKSICRSWLSLLFLFVLIRTDVCAGGYRTWNRKYKLRCMISKYVVEKLDIRRWYLGTNRECVMRPTCIHAYLSASEKCIAATAFQYRECKQLSKQIESCHKMISHVAWFNYNSLSIEMVRRWNFYLQNLQYYRRRGLC